MLVPELFKCMLADVHQLILASLKWLWDAAPRLYAEINFTFWRTVDAVTVEYHFGIFIG